MAIQWTSNTDPLHPVIKLATVITEHGAACKLAFIMCTGGGGISTEYLDYGGGNRDNNATLSINGGTPQAVTLPLVFFPLSVK